MRVFSTLVCTCQFLAVVATQCEVDTGGTCNFAGCDATRGPTYCSKMDDFSCICKPGYCVLSKSKFDSELKKAEYFAGKCEKNPDLAEECDIDQSQDVCTAATACSGQNQECSGAIYGVCQCKPGFCKDSNGDCAAPALSLSATAESSSEEAEEFNDAVIEELFVTCKKQTGGTCRWFSCGSSRNSHCDTHTYKCVCGPNQCAVGGKCVHFQPNSQPMYRRHPGGVREAVDGHVCEHGWRARWRDGSVGLCRGFCCRHRNRFTHRLTRASFCRVHEHGRQILRECRPLMSDLSEEEATTETEGEEEDLYGWVALIAGVGFATGVSFASVVFWYRRRFSVRMSESLLA